MKASGRVYLVGAGPGDPALLTLKGLRALEQADVVVYDHLVSPQVLDFAPESAERIYAGKEAGAHALPQEEINALLATRALEGKVVVRLKGGDPFVFGRGGEEALHLASVGVPFEVVPGVTSAVAAPAYAGIPLTHRNLASSVVVLTGHEDPTKQESSTRWTEVAKGVDTLVFLMAMANLPLIAARLIQHGRSPDEPAALIRWGTTADQQTVVGTLGSIVADAERAALKPPALLVVGRVVRLRERIAWFERRPLFGKRIVVTRPRQQSSRFAHLLEEAGAEVLRIPTIKIEPPESWELLDRALAEIESFRWVIFTSVNGVKSFRRRLEATGRDARSLHGTQLAAIGPETAEALKRWGLRSDVVPDEFVAEGLVEVLKGRVRPGDRLLLPRAAQARDLLVKEMERLGVLVTDAPTYRAVASKEGADRLRRELEAGRVHVVTFTSSSTAKNFADLFSAEERGELFRGVVVASIGPITAATAARHGFETDVMPSAYTIPALAQAIVEHFERERS
jgi:uroporphyrinogen III methyltransferase/synthase